MVRVPHNGSYLSFIFTLNLKMRFEMVSKLLLGWFCIGFPWSYPKNVRHRRSPSHAESLGATPQTTRSSQARSTRPRWSANFPRSRFTSADVAMATIGRNFRKFRRKIPNLLKLPGFLARKRRKTGCRNHEENEPTFQSQRSCCGRTVFKMFCFLLMDALETLPWAVDKFSGQQSC